MEIVKAGGKGFGRALERAFGELPEAYKGDVRKFREYSGAVPDEASLRAYIADMKKRGRKVSTIKRHTAALKKWVREALGGELTINGAVAFDVFFRELARKTGKSDYSVPAEKVLKPEEIAALVSVAGKKTGVLVKSLYESAARVSELLNVPLENCKQTPAGVIVEILGKRRRERKVFLKSETFAEIKKLYSGKKYLFEGKKGKPLSRITANQLIKRAGKKIGREISPHTLRHSFATSRLGDLGLSGVSSYLGHSALGVTQKFYVHSKPEIEKVLAGV